MRRFFLTMLTLCCAFILSCAASAPDDCAFQAQDGTCAIELSESGDLVCTLDDAALCKTMIAHVEGDEESLGSSSAALRGGGGPIGGGTALVCEPDGTFMCTCCS